MTATATAASKTSHRRPWAPDGNDHLIFDFVRMKGKTQEWVAEQLGISQATVSRVVQRYERWQAHAKDREGGRLDPAERLRAQRWLAAERHELMLASCLRIADQMQGLYYSSTMTRERGPDSNIETIRTRQEEVDRSGIAARFYRLAFRINMELLKLAEKDQPPLPPPLSAEEIDEQEAEAAAATEELQEAHQKTIREFDENHRRDMEEVRETERLKQIEDAERLALAEEILREQETGDKGQESETTAASSAVNNVHNLHNENGSKNGASDCATDVCVADAPAQKNSRRLHKAPERTSPQTAERGGGEPQNGRHPANHRVKSGAQLAASG